MIHLNLLSAGQRMRQMLAHSIVAAALLGSASAHAEVGGSCARERVIGVASVWSAVRWHQVHLAEHAVDWDRALAEALPALCAAANDQALAEAVGVLMQPLRDPFFRTVRPENAPRIQLKPGAEWPVEWLPGNVALLHLHQGTAWSRQDGSVMPAMQRAIDAITARAQGVVIDLRPVNRHEFVDANALESAVAQFIGTDLQLPGARSLLRSDFQFDPVTHTGGRRSGFFTAESRLLRRSATARTLSLSLLVDGNTHLPAVALALDKRHMAHVLRVGSALPRAGVSKQVTVSKGLAVEFTVGEHVFEDGTTATGAAGDGLPDDSLSSAVSPAVMAAANRLNSEPAAALSYQRVAATLPAREADARRDMKPPDLPWRQVAAIRYWSTADAVVPAEQRISDVVAQDALIRMFDAMTDARTRGGYIDALSTFTVALADTHAELMGRMAWDHAGAATVPIRLKQVEGRYLVVEVQPGPVPRSGSLQPGDEVAQLDGVPIADAVKRAWPKAGGSTDAARERNVLRSLLRGAPGTVLQVGVVGAGGTHRTVDMARIEAPAAGPTAPPGPHFRRLTDDIGYVDLVNLLPEQVDALFELLGTSKGLIVDLRGYPKGAAWALAKRLNSREDAPGPLFSQPIVGTFGAAQGLANADRIGTSAPAFAPYTGKVVVLTSIEGQSQTEHAVLLLEAAAPITVVGEPTTGTNGHVAVDVLPGGVYAAVGTMDVRHADGRRLQRVGIQPHVVVHQTVEGVRSGRDEQLEAALRLLTQPR